MNTATATAGYRKNELEAEIAQSMTAQRKAEGELQKLQSLGDQVVVELGELRLRHIEECRRQAQQGTSRHAQVAETIASTEARGIGLNALITDQKAEIAAIAKQREPFEAELRDIERTEYLARERAVIENFFADGRDEIETRNRITDSFAHRLVQLRNVGDAELKSLAYDYAYKLQCLWEGRTP